MGRESFEKLQPSEKLSSSKARDNKEASRGDMRELTEDERLVLRKTIGKALRSKKKRQ